jgi:hypothetical protein
VTTNVTGAGHRNTDPKLLWPIGTLGRASQALLTGFPEVGELSRLDEDLDKTRGGLEPGCIVLVIWMRQNVSARTARSELSSKMLITGDLLHSLAGVCSLPWASTTCI